MANFEETDKMIVFVMAGNIGGVEDLIMTVPFECLTTTIVVKKQFKPVEYIRLFFTNTQCSRMSTTLCHTAFPNPNMLGDTRKTKTIAKTITNLSSDNGGHIKGTNAAYS
jgi:hypothetical protein